MPQPHSLGFDPAKVRAAMDARGWTAYRLAAESGVRQQVISKLLNGERTDPYFSTVCRLADALGVKVDRFR